MERRGVSPQRIPPPKHKLKKQVRPNRLLLFGTLPSFLMQASIGTSCSEFSKGLQKRLQENNYIILPEMKPGYNNPNGRAKKKAEQCSASAKRLF
jgi:hypothetical protein